MNENQLIKDISNGVEYIGELTYRNFLDSFDSSENDFNDLTKLEASICAIFLFDYMIADKKVTQDFRRDFYSKCVDDLEDRFSDRLDDIDLTDFINDKYTIYANIPIKSGNNWQQSLLTNLEFNLKATKGNKSMEETDPLDIIRTFPSDPMLEMPQKMQFIQEEIKNSYRTAKMVEELFNGKSFAEAIKTLRALESNAGEIKIKSKKEGCYVATMIYGDYNASEVLILRHYRDTILTSTIIGKFMIKFYYATSPIAVRLFKNNKEINCLIKIRLDKIVQKLENRFREKKQ